MYSPGNTVYMQCKDLVFLQFWGLGLGFAIHTACSLSWISVRRVFISHNNYCCCVSAATDSTLKIRKYIHMKCQNLCILCISTTSRLQIPILLNLSEATTSCLLRLDGGLWDSLCLWLCYGEVPSLTSDCRADRRSSPGGRRSPWPS